jgi:hypothetical protein
MVFGASELILSARGEHFGEAMAVSFGNIPR